MGGKYRRTLGELAEHTVQEIIKDLRARKVIGEAWDSLDEVAQRSAMDKWIEIVIRNH